MSRATTMTTHSSNMWSLHPRDGAEHHVQGSSCKRTFYMVVATRICVVNRLPFIVVVPLLCALFRKAL